MPEFVKPLAEVVFGSRLAYRTGSRLRVPRSLVLAFHNVISDDTEPRGDRSLHLPVEVFCAIADWLAEAFDVVPLEHVFEEAEGPASRPRAAITFDDAYKGAISVAIPELVVRGLPATIFAIAGAEAGQTFWWDALADGHPAGMPPGVRDAAIAAAYGRQADVLDWAADMGHPITELGGEFVASPWSAIERAASLPGITIASHTMTHPSLPTLSQGELVDELTRSRLDLQARMPSARSWLTYPYGHSSPEVERAAAAAGYEMALRVSGGVVFAGDATPARFSLPRLNIPAGLSLQGLRLRAAGLLRR